MLNKEGRRRLEDLLPLNPIVFNILSVLGAKIMHGYEIKKKVEADLEKPVSAATLYRHLKIMREDYLIEEVAMHIDDDDPRRQYFKMTAYGQSVYAAEYNRLRPVLRDPVGLFDKGQMAAGDS